MEIRFSTKLQNKIKSYQKFEQDEIQVGSISFKNPFLLAPMSGISKAPFRLLMEMLGAGGTVSELISAHGISYQNQKTLDMLKVFPEEKFVGIQIFGEDPERMAYAAKLIEDRGAPFVDINMGCPVRKVVTKGAGSSLLRDPKKLSSYIATVKRAIKIPLTIKIRTGWNTENAHEVLRVAKEEGVEMVAIHGRTRDQQYKGEANWGYLESLGKEKELPLVANGDLFDANRVRQKWKLKIFDGLMIGRGALKNPFIFLEAQNLEGEALAPFHALDYLEITKIFNELLEEYTNLARFKLMSLKNFVAWSSSGFPGAREFRPQIYTAEDESTLLARAEEFYGQLGTTSKHQIDFQKFMQGGHG